MRKLGVSLFFIALLLVLTGVCQAQYVPDPDVYGKIKGAYQPLTLTARIGYSKDRGGYYIKNNPRYGFGDKVILNQNIAVLAKLARRGKFHTIYGRVSPLEFRANHVFIEGIDGKPYHGKHAPLVRIY